MEFTHLTPPGTESARPTPPLSVQLWTVRAALAADRDGTLARLAEAGYTAVEPFQPLDDPKGFRAAADSLGLTVSSVHAKALLDDDPDAVLDAVAVLGTDLAIVPAGIEAAEFTTAEGLDRAAATLNALAEHAAARGIRIGYHNHWWELEPLVDGKHGLEGLAERLAPEVVLEVDTYWAAVGGADVPALLRRLGDRVVALHVKDGPMEKGVAQTAVGAGRMPVAEVLAAAPHALRVVELDDCDGDVLEAVAASRVFLTDPAQPWNAGGRA